MITKNFTFGDICAGIGGFSLGFERAGMTCAYQIEKDHFCRAVLTKHWPNVPKWEDLLEIKKGELPTTNLMAGGIPCQPHSVAGQRKGKKDDRNLWPAYFQIIKWKRPDWAIVENVPGIRSTIFDNLVFDLESIGYAVCTLNIPIAGFNAPHIRYRYIIVAHANRQRCSRTPAITEQTGRQCLERRNWWAVEPPLGRVVDGFPGRMVQCKAIGNAVGPQLAEWLGRIILKVEKCKI